MEGLKDSFNHYFRAKKFALRPERKDKLLKQHRGIYQAIRRKNPEEAKARILEHLEYVEEVIGQDLLKERLRIPESSSPPKGSSDKVLQ
jgi:DNA-binding FadR family transcriptional regulator